MDGPQPAERRGHGQLVGPLHLLLGPLLLGGLDGAAERLALFLADRVVAGGRLRLGLGGRLCRCRGFGRRGSLALGRGEQGGELLGRQELLADEDVAEAAVVDASLVVGGHLVLEAGVELHAGDQALVHGEIADAHGLDGPGNEGLAALRALDPAAEVLVRERVLTAALATDFGHGGPLRFPGDRQGSATWMARTRKRLGCAGAPTRSPARRALL